MEDYKTDEKKLSMLCAKCMGKCCNGASITISEKEFNNLKDRYAFNTKNIETPFGNILTIKVPRKSSCPFLGVKNDKTGCILAEKDKPLSCRLFPLTFIIEDKKPKFYLSMFCSCFEDVMALDRWIDKSIKTAKKELKSWTDEELNSCSYVHSKAYPNKKFLIEIVI